MSSILKALEKVDESQRQRRSAGGGIGRGRDRRPAWLVPAWTLGGAAVAALVTYALMGGFSRPAQVVERPARPAAAHAPAVVEQQPVAEKPQPVQRKQQQEVAPPAPRSAAVPAAKVVAKPAQRVAGAALKATASGSPAGTRKPVKPAAKVAATQAATKQAPVVKGAHPLQNARPVSNAALQPAPVEAAAVSVAREPAVQKSSQAIRVTGIAWQNSSESSFAMVNGRAMRQGAMVEGYKIEQIYEDSVRFSNSKGSSLVVPLGAGDD